MVRSLRLLAISLLVALAIAWPIGWPEGPIAALDAVKSIMPDPVAGDWHEPSAWHGVGPTSEAVLSDSFGGAEILGGALLVVLLIRAIRSRRLTRQLVPGAI